MEYKRVAIDTSKHVFTLHAVDASGRAVLRRDLSRARLVPFLASLGSPNPQTIGHRRVGIYLAPPHFHQLGLVWTLANVLWAVIFAGAIASLAVRYRRGRDTERRQLLWLLLVGLVLVPWVGVIWGIFNAGPILGLLALSLIPVAVTVAILRHQLLDIRVVVSRALLYGLLTAAAIGAYAGLVALLDLMVRSQVSFGVAVAASIIVAFCFNPARVRLQRLIDRALYGDRRDPVRAAREIRIIQPAIAVLVLSQFLENRYAIDLLGDQPKGIGYLLKDHVSDVGSFAESVRRLARWVGDRCRRRARPRGPAAHPCSR